MTIIQKGEPMRAIDGDVLKDRLQSLAYDDWNQGVTTSWADAYRECADMVDEQPTIEPEPKKGRWIEDAETFYKAVNKNGGGVDANTPYFTEDDIACSECLALFSVIDNCTECFDFCPSCGADMREGETDGCDS